MLRFLKRLRARLLAQKRVGAYLLYALGEVVLVVIGILIAVQVNEWNELRKARLERVRIEGEVHREFARNDELLRRSLDLNQQAFRANFALLELIGAESVELAKHDLDELLNASLFAEFYFPSRNTIEDVTRSGRSGLFEDDLRNALLEWSTALEIMSAYKDVQTNWQNDQLLPFLLHRVSFRQMDAHNDNPWGGKSGLDVDYEPVFQELAFENLLDNNLWLLQFTIERLEEIGRIQSRILELTAVDGGRE